MNNVRSLVQGTGIPFGPGPSLQSDAMLNELLTLHEEMIGQLRVARVGSQTMPDFLKGMIEQHEAAAAKLREQLQGYEAKTA